MRRILLQGFFMCLMLTAMVGCEKAPNLIEEDNKVDTAYLRNVKVMVYTMDYLANEKTPIKNANVSLFKTKEDREIGVPTVADGRTDEYGIIQFDGLQSTRYFVRTVTNAAVLETEVSTPNGVTTEHEVLFAD